MYVLGYVAFFERKCGVSSFERILGLPGGKFSVVGEGRACRFTSCSDKFVGYFGGQLGGSLLLLVVNQLMPFCFCSDGWLNGVCLRSSFDFFPDGKLCAMIEEFPPFSPV